MDRRRELWVYRGSDMKAGRHTWLLRKCTWAQHRETISFLSDSKCCLGSSLGEMTFSHAAEGQRMVNCHPSSGNIWKYLGKWKMLTSCGPASPCLCISIENCYMCAPESRNDHYPNLYNGEGLEFPKCQSVWEWINQICHIYVIELWF